MGYFLNKVRNISSPKRVFAPTFVWRKLRELSEGIVNILVEYYISIPHFYILL